MTNDDLDELFSPEGFDEISRRGLNNLRAHQREYVEANRRSITAMFGGSGDMHFEETHTGETVEEMCRRVGGILNSEEGQKELLAGFDYLKDILLEERRGFFRSQLDLEPLYEELFQLRRRYELGEISRRDLVAKAR